jgi:TRAP-type uncharacterized transport system substrate-binding protein
VRWNASAPNVAITQLLHGDIDAYSEAVTGGRRQCRGGRRHQGLRAGPAPQDYVFLAKQGINSLADLKGMNIGVQDATGVNYAKAVLVGRRAA